MSQNGENCDTVLIYCIWTIILIYFNCTSHLIYELTGSKDFYGLNLKFLVFIYTAWCSFSKLWSHLFEVLFSRSLHGCGTKRHLSRVSLSVWKDLCDTTASSADLSIAFQLKFKVVLRTFSHVGVAAKLFTLFSMEMERLLQALLFNLFKQTVEVAVLSINCIFINADSLYLYCCHCNW